jgi:hypothetical protein
VNKTSQHKKSKEQNNGSKANADQNNSNKELPAQLKSGVEALSGVDMSDTQVHKNSALPAQFKAHAFAQGSDIHLASGQEKHLPHEAWHVAQQKQGRVQPTKQLKGKTNINDDPSLEKEADVMGAKAMSVDADQDEPLQKKASSSNELTSQMVIQREGDEDYEENDTVAAVGDGLNKANTVAGAAGGATGFATGAATANVKAADKGGKAASSGDKKDAAYAKTSDQVISTLGVVNTFAQSFRGGYQAYKEGDLAEGGKNLLEGGKGVVGAVELAGKYGNDAISATGNLMPGLSAGLSAFQNVISMASAKNVYTKVSALDAAVDKGEISEIGSYLKRVAAKIGEELLDFIFNAAEVITAAFPAAFVAVKTIHTCVNLFKAGAKAYYSYVAKKGEQADQRVSGGDEDAIDDRSDYEQYHKMLTAGSQDGVDNSVKGMIYAADTVKQLELEYYGLPDDASSEKQQELNGLLINARGNLKRFIHLYNINFSPKPALTVTNVNQLLKIHKNVIATILNQASQEKKGLSFYRRHRPEKKDLALKEFQEDLNMGESIDPDQIKLSELRNLNSNEYFWGKSVKQIKS